MSDWAVSPEAYLGQNRPQWKLSPDQFLKTQGAAPQQQYVGGDLGPDTTRTFSEDDLGELANRAKAAGMNLTPDQAAAQLQREGWTVGTRPSAQNVTLPRGNPSLTDFAGDINLEREEGADRNEDEGNTPQPKIPGMEKLGPLPGVPGPPVKVEPVPLLGSFETTRLPPQPKAAGIPPNFGENVVNTAKTLGQAATTPFEQGLSQALGTEKPPTMTELYDKSMPALVEHAKSAVDTAFGVGTADQLPQDFPWAPFVGHLANEAARAGMSIMDFGRTPAGAATPAATMLPATGQAAVGAGYAASMEPGTEQQIRQAVAEPSQQNVARAIVATALNALPAAAAIPSLMETRRGKAAPSEAVPEQGTEPTAEETQAHPVPGETAAPAIPQWTLSPEEFLKSQEVPAPEAQRTTTELQAEPAAGAVQTGEIEPRTPVAAPQTNANATVPVEAQAQQPGEIPPAGQEPNQPTETPLPQASAVPSGAEPAPEATASMAGWKLPPEDFLKSETGSVPANVAGLGLPEFVKQDVAPAVATTAEALRQGWDDVRKVFAPATRGPEAAGTAQIVREQAADLAQRTDRATAALQDARALFSRQAPEKNYDFINRIETGVQQQTPEFQQIADTMRDMLDSRRDEIQKLGTGKLQKFIENYFPHIWKDSNQAQAFLGQWFAKGPLEGPKSFLKQRTLPTTADGLAAGLEPVSTNPVDLVLLRRARWISI
jgi:hypothetical protein